MSLLSISYEFECYQCGYHWRYDVQVDERPTVMMSFPSVAQMEDVAVKAHRKHWEEKIAHMTSPQLESLQLVGAKTHCFGRIILVNAEKHYS